ncbi:hypothetical protein N431DRAFT_559347 [Stipitochalara longipes BDJ]|nr:hypothetical protein N431DRAFT_559347 [Stipitochalara longipes BDJ]
MDFITNISTKDTDRLLFDTENFKTWEALNALMKRSWFARRWVVQGLAFARHTILHCETATVKWARFCEAIPLFAEKLDEIVTRESYSKHLLSLQLPGQLSALVPALVNFAIPPLIVAIIGAFNLVLQEAMAPELSHSSVGQLRGVGAHSLIAVYDKVLPHERDGEELHRLWTMEPLLS